MNGIRAGNVNFYAGQNRGLNARQTMFGDAKLLNVKSSVFKSTTPDWGKSIGFSGSKDILGNPIGTSQANGKKQLSYDPKKFTRAIMRAKTPQSATSVAAQVRSLINELNNKLNTGEYDVEEITAAIAHAEMIEQAALKRASNLQIEAEAERAAERKEEMKEMIEPDNGGLANPSDEAVESGEKTDLLKEIEKQVEEAKTAEEAEQLQKLLDDTEKAFEEFDETQDFFNQLDEMATALSGEMTPEEIEEMKKRHRASENAAIEQADMEYLKQKFDRLQRQLNANKAGLSAAMSADRAAAAKPVSASAPVSADSVKTNAHVPSSASSVMSSSGGSAGGAFAGASIDVGV